MNEEENKIAALVGDRQLRPLLAYLETLPQERQQEGRDDALYASVLLEWMEAVEALLPMTHHAACLTACAVVAASAGHLPLVRLLLEHGAPLNKVNRYGASPLSAAVSSSNAALVRFLLESGAKVNRMDNPNDELPLCHLGCHPGAVEVARLLLEAGAEPNPAGCRHHPLSALLSGCPVEPVQLEVARLLLEAGANPNGRGTADSEAPLHRAARRGCLRLLSLLLEYGASLELPDAEGHTPLYAALDAAQPAAARCLLEAGADASFLRQDAVGGGNSFPAPQAWVIWRPFVCCWSWASLPSRGMSLWRATH